MPFAPPEAAPNSLSTCPFDYATAPEALRCAAELSAETLYVVGGLYGNPEALQAVLALKAEEECWGATVTLVFNGDHNWFNVGAEVFRGLNEAVLEFPAIAGNVEAELGREPAAGGGENSAAAPSAGCGCGYPAYLGRDVAERSDLIFARLWETALAVPEVRVRLAALPRQLVANVGGRRIGIVHGDPASLAGWSLAQEALAHLEGEEHPARSGGAPVTALEQVRGYFRAADADAFATSHTCLPFARVFDVEGYGGERRGRVLINNGSAGMPNFRGLPGGVLTRISALPDAHPRSLYGACSAGLRYEALPVAYDHAAWVRRFNDWWPPGSPAQASYAQRMLHGPDYTLAHACRTGFHLRAPSNSA